MTKTSTIPKTKSTSFRLTEQALEQLIALAEKYGASQVAVLEHLIRDRFSVSDQKKNSDRRNAAWIAHCEWVAGVEATDEKAKYLFVSGYNKGWRDFQTRHDEDKYIIEL